MEKIVAEKILRGILNGDCFVKTCKDRDGRSCCLNYKQCTLLGLFNMLHLSRLKYFFYFKLCSNTEVMVTARGYKPENLIFLVHEVFECLIADSYSGVSYDYSIPCVECVAEVSCIQCKKMSSL